MAPPDVTLKTRADPWRERIFRKMVRAPENLAPGQWVRLLDKEGHFLAWAHCNLHSQLTVRPLTDDPAFNPDEPAARVAFYQARLKAARQFRESTLGLTPAGGYRLIHSDADRLPGLSVDVFGSGIAVELYTAGMAADLPALRAALQAIYPDQAIHALANQRAAKLEGFSLSAESGPESNDAPGEIVEHGLRYEVAIGRGHKTGFFLDQRDNRARIGSLARGRSVLDLCCYTGGFALNAWKGGAASVQAVDLDEKAIAQARRNAALNNAPADAIRFTHGDAFDVLRTAAKTAAPRADLIVLDPPKLAEDRHDLESAARKYRDLMRLALLALAPGGILLTCSCSGPISEEMFIQYLQAAAQDASVDAAIFQIAGAAPDHPIGLHALENRYLKALFCRKYSA